MYSRHPEAACCPGLGVCGLESDFLRPGPDGHAGSCAASRWSLSCAGRQFPIGNEGVTTACSAGPWCCCRVSHRECSASACTPPSALDLSPPLRGPVVKPRLTQTRSPRWSFHVGQLSAAFPTGVWAAREPKDPGQSTGGARAVVLETFHVPLAPDLL